jgi:hypothetical protein
LAKSAPGINERNSFGWFETDGRNVVGHPQQLFSATDPVGTVANFQPTGLYGFYFHDLSEGGFDETRGDCLVFTLSSQNTPPCTSQGLFHNMAAFATNPNSPLTSFWIAGLNAPGECNPAGGADCNLTLVSVGVPVPGPIAGAGLPGLILACGALLAFARRRRRQLVA